MAPRHVVCVAEESAVLSTSSDSPWWLCAVSLLWACLSLAPAVTAQTYPAPTYSVPNATPPPATIPPPPGAGAPLMGRYLVPPQLEDLVARIALYPDDLVGIILPASTFPLQVVAAARYLDEARADASRAPDPGWDDAIVALLNYPDVVNMMNRDLEWTEQLGDAVVNQQADVVSAIGRFRQRAQAAGNLRTDERQVVEYQQNEIRIRPANPQVIYVPYYEPQQVLVYQPQPAFSYFPRPCPVYYYNYASGYPTGFSRFWGVSSMFTISWGASRVRRYDYDYFDSPWYDRPPPGFYYRRGWHDHHDWHGRDRDWDRDGRDWDRHDRDGRDHGPRRGPRERDWEPRREQNVGGRPRDDRGQRDFRPGGSAAGAAGPSPAVRQQFSAPMQPRDAQRGFDDDRGAPRRFDDDRGARVPRNSPRTAPARNEPRGVPERRDSGNFQRRGGAAGPPAQRFTPNSAGPMPGSGFERGNPRPPVTQRYAPGPQRFEGMGPRPVPQMQRFDSPSPRATQRPQPGPSRGDMARPSRGMQRDFSAPNRATQSAPRASTRSSVGPSPAARGGGGRMGGGERGGGRGQRD